MHNRASGSDIGRHVFKNDLFPAHHTHLDPGTDQAAAPHPHQNRRIARLDSRVWQPLRLNWIHASGLFHQLHQNRLRVCGRKQAFWLQNSPIRPLNREPLLFRKDGFTGNHIRFATDIAEEPTAAFGFSDNAEGGRRDLRFQRKESCVRGILSRVLTGFSAASKGNHDS